MYELFYLSDVNRRTTTGKDNSYVSSHLLNVTTSGQILRFVDRASRYNSVKKNQRHAQLILNIFRQPPQVSGVSRPIIRRYNHMYTTFGTYNSF